MTEQEEQPSRLQQQKETKWYDAWIRWEKGSKETYDDEEEEQNDDPPLIPTDTYHSSYKVNTATDVTNTINLELQGFASESEAIWTSTGLTLWRSSEFLCDFLVKHYPSLVKTHNDTPCRILEVGSGLGRSGILMHLLAYASSEQEEEKEAGCVQEVVLTDGDTDVLAQLRSNVQQNLTLNASLMQNSDGSSVENKSDLSCHQLIWGEDHAKAFVNRPCFQTGNHADDYFDVMIGSDLIYVTQVIEPLFETVHTLLRPVDGVFLMAHCARREGNEVDLDMVLDQAHNVGLKHTQLYPSDDKSCENDDEDGIYLYRFEWAANN